MSGAASSPSLSRSSSDFDEEKSSQDMLDDKVRLIKQCTVVDLSETKCAALAEDANKGSIKVCVRARARVRGGPAPSTATVCRASGCAGGYRQGDFVRPSARVRRR